MDLTEQNKLDGDTSEAQTSETTTKESMVSSSRTASSTTTPEAEDTCMTTAGTPKAKASSFSEITPKRRKITPETLDILREETPVYSTRREAGPLYGERRIREEYTDPNEWTFVCPDRRVLRSTAYNWQIFFKSPNCHIDNSQIDWILAASADSMSYASAIFSRYIRTSEWRELSKSLDQIFMTPISDPSRNHHAIIFFDIHRKHVDLYQVNVISYAPAIKPNHHTIKRRIETIFPKLKDHCHITVKLNQSSFCDVFRECHSRLLVMYGLLGLEVFQTNPTTLESAWSSFVKALQPTEDEDECQQTLTCVRQAAFQIAAGSSFSFKDAFVKCLDELDGLKTWRLSTPRNETVASTNKVIGDRNLTPCPISKSIDSATSTDIIIDLTLDDEPENQSEANDEDSDDDLVEIGYVQLKPPIKEEPNTIKKELSKQPSPIVKQEDSEEPFPLSPPNDDEEMSQDEDMVNSNSFVDISQTSLHDKEKRQQQDSVEPKSSSRSTRTQENSPHVDSVNSENCLRSSQASQPHTEEKPPHINPVKSESFQGIPLASQPHRDTKKFRCLIIDEDESKLSIEEDFPESNFIASTPTQTTNLLSGTLNEYLNSCRLTEKCRIKALDESLANLGHGETSLHCQSCIKCLEASDVVSDLELYVSKQRYMPLVSDIFYETTSDYWNKPLTPERVNINVFKSLYLTHSDMIVTRTCSFGDTSKPAVELNHLKTRMAVPLKSFCVDFTISSLPEDSTELRVYSGYQPVAVKHNQFVFDVYPSGCEPRPSLNGQDVSLNPFKDVEKRLEKGYMKVIREVCGQAIIQFKGDANYQVTDDDFLNVDIMKNIVCVFKLPVSSMWYQYHPVFIENPKLLEETPVVKAVKKTKLNQTMREFKTVVKQESKTAVKQESKTAVKQESKTAVKQESKTAVKQETSSPTKRRKAPQRSNQPKSTSVFPLSSTTTPSKPGLKVVTETIESKQETPIPLPPEQSQVSQYSAQSPSSRRRDGTPSVIPSAKARASCTNKTNKTSKGIKNFLG